MIRVRKKDDRGFFDHGWLQTYHTFSFADYQDPDQMGFRSLRVINEDYIAPGAGFNSHPHRDMEIITYPIEGGLEHRDSLGNGSIIRSGEIQYMCAGTGVTHSEYNSAKNERTHLLQIWILPDRKGHRPAYGQRKFSLEKNQLHLLISGFAREDSVQINRAVRIFAGRLNSEGRIEYAIEENRHNWIQVIKGELSINDIKLEAGDGAAISDETKLQLMGFDTETESEFLLFDLD